MYESQPIELFWDNSADLNAQTVAALNSSGFRARPIALGQFTNQLVENEAGPRVVCVQVVRVRWRLIFELYVMC
jgi:hypothetical protein